MELYGGNNPARNGSQYETGLEESMLGVRSSQSYPDRPGVSDCVYYMRTGFCDYGYWCRYNHPCNRTAVEAAVRATGEYPERPGEPACQGEGKCSYYLKTGQCKSGITCKFHHPQPAGTSTPVSAPQFYPPVQPPSVSIPEQYGGASTSLRVARPPLLPGSIVQGAYGPVLFPQGEVPIPSWSPYSAPVRLSPGAQPAVGATSLYGVTQLSLSTPALAGPYPFLPASSGHSSGIHKEQAFPERPGKSECQYYLRTGGCKFGSACRYHHPQDRVLSRTNCVLSPMGLPIRPLSERIEMSSSTNNYSDLTEKRTYSSARSRGHHSGRISPSPRRQPPPPPPPFANSKLIIRNLPLDPRDCKKECLEMTLTCEKYRDARVVDLPEDYNFRDGIKKYLKMKFEKYGKVKAVDLPEDRKSCSLRGYGFVEFSTIDDAILAKDKMHNKEIGGLSIMVDFVTDLNLKSNEILEMVRQSPQFKNRSGPYKDPYSTPPSSPSSLLGHC